MPAGRRTAPRRTPRPHSLDRHIHRLVAADRPGRKVLDRSDRPALAAHTDRAGHVAFGGTPASASVPARPRAAALARHRSAAGALAAGLVRFAATTGGLRKSR